MVYNINSFSKMHESVLLFSNKLLEQVGISFELLKNPIIYVLQSQSNPASTPLPFKTPFFLVSLS